MSPKKIRWMWWSLVFLIAPKLWGAERDGFGSFLLNVQVSCQEMIEKKMEAWPKVTEITRIRMATTLCDDDRIVWNFAEGRFGKRAIDYEAGHRPPDSFKPIVVGVSSKSPEEIDETVLALREILYPLSSVFQWTGDRTQLRTWQNQFYGGKFGGIIHVHIDTETVGKIHEGVSQASDAMTYATAHKMDTFALVVSADRDVNTLFPPAKSSITWVPFGSLDCDRNLRF